MPTQSFPWSKNYDPGVPQAVDVPDLPLFSMLDATVREFGERPAFDFLGKKYSWAEIGDLVDRFACGLQKSGIGRGMKVGLFLPNSPIYLIAYYGILKAGATIVNYNPLYAEHELAHQIEDSETDVMVTFDMTMLYGKMAHMLQTTRLKKLVVARFADILPFPKKIVYSLFKRGDIAKIPESSNILWFSDLTAQGTEIAPTPVNPKEDIAVLQYTGGTTGTPKGAMLTHRNLYANTLQSVAWFADVQRGQEKMLAVLPFFHVFAMTAIMNFSVAAGLEIIALPRFRLGQTLWTIHAKKPNYFPAVPAIYGAINTYRWRDFFDLSALKFCISGGAPLPVEVKKAFERNTGCIVVEGYGLTESSPVVCVNPVRGRNIAGSIGLPVSNTIVEIISREDHKTPMPVGERGELCIRGPQVMRGYWNKPDETSAVLKPTGEGDMRLHTGDVAVMDSDGYVYIVDRIKDMIITNGYNVYPRNVEEAIYMHPAVEECIVAGLPDAQRGEIVKAWIKRKPGQNLSAEQLKDFLEIRISRMEIPKLIEFRDKPLPKTMIGKLSRKDVVAEEKGKSS